VRTFEVLRPRPTRDSARRTAAATPSTTGTGTAFADRLAEVGHAAAAEHDGLGTILLDRRGGLIDDRGDRSIGILLELEHGHPRSPHGHAVRIEPGQQQPILDERDGSIERRDHGEAVAEEQRQSRPRLGDVDDGHVEELLQTLPSVLSVPGLDHGIELAGVFEHGIHDAEGGKIALDVALAGFRPEFGGQADDLRACRSGLPGRLGDAFGHGSASYSR
jgi:hypothetical protein